jgi:NADPH:quinone reductase-like Zn-dependent oxidoreductase
VGKTTFEGSLNCLRPRGLMALFGGSSGPVPPFDLIQLSGRGSLFITRPTLWHYVATRKELECRAGEVMGWVASAWNTCIRWPRPVARKPIWRIARRRARFCWNHEFSF